MRAAGTETSKMVGHVQRNNQYHRILQKKGIIHSMSRKGNCLDNSLMENFFGKMKNEMFYGKEYTFRTLTELKKAMEEYIAYYNTDKRTIIRTI